ncbi:MAG: aminopeptidase N [Streptomycetaceae bacterium]|nr:MAG: aminopeptidase N [Streptomycetaceae bacterium]
MSGLNISSLEASERSAHLWVESYTVTLNIVPGLTTFYSKSVVHFTSTQAGYSTFIDAPAHSIISATLNGSPIDTYHYDGESVFLPNLALENELVIEMNAIFSKNGEGLQYSVDPLDGQAYLYTQGAPALMRHVYACFDQPDLKATLTLSAIVPRHWEAISNSPLVSREEIDELYSLCTFAPTARLATYITAFIAGPYHHVHDQYVGEKNIPLGIYCRKSLAEQLDPDEIFKVTKQGFAFFEKVFGLGYPFDKYDQIAVVDFNWGAMENVGAVTFKEEKFVFRSKATEQMRKNRAMTIMHEMSHMWFGNLVTMQWWNDLWLNESFAEWAGYLAVDESTDFKGSWTSFNSKEKTWAYNQDQLISTHPIVVSVKDIEEANTNFDGITYAKGASALQQLVSHVGRDNFILGLRNYFAKHAFSNTTLADLLHELELTSGRDLTSWAKTWLQTAGVNTLRPALTIEDGSYSSISIIQETPLMPVDSTELRPHRLAVGLYDLVGNEIKIRRSVELDVAGPLTQVSELSGEKTADLLLINDQDLTYAKIRFDEDSLSTLKLHLGKISDSLTRALCWGAAWDMVRDAEISSRDFIEIASSGLPAEDDVTVFSIITDQLGTVVNLFTHDKDRHELRMGVAKVLESIMDTSLPGGDLQLQSAKAFASLAISTEQNARITNLLDGGLNGLVIDVDLRWHLVQALVERGLYSREQLDKELTADPSTLGQLAHSLAIAAIPLLTSKELAWKTITDQRVATDIRKAMMRGFHLSTQHEFSEAFVDRYFSQLLVMWGGNSFESASSFAELAYPRFLTSESTLTKTNYWLNGAGRDAPSGLRRLVLEARDSLERAIKVQKLS